MAGVSVALRLVGVDALDRRLRKKQRMFRRQLRNELMKIARSVRKQAKANTPLGDDTVFHKGSGYTHAKNLWKPPYVRVRKDMVLAKITNEAYWARWTEFGTKDRKGRGRLQAQGYLSEAVAAHQAEAMRLLGRKLVVE